MMNIQRTPINPKFSGTPAKPSARSEQQPKRNGPEDEFILVTGGAGYIGSHFILDYLSKKPANQKVVVVDDLSHSNKNAVSLLEKTFPGRVKFYKGKIGDKTRIATLLKQFKVKAVVHYAGSISVPESQSNPGKYYENNTGQTIGLLKAMEEANVKNIIFSSTAAVYGKPDQKDIPLLETAPTEPINNYGRSKLFVENILRSFFDSKKLSFIALRYFNVAGADPQGRIGEAHLKEEHLIPAIFEAAVTGSTFPMKGADFPVPPTKDGTGVRDFIHVMDLSDAHIKALDKLEAAEKRGESVGKAYNVGNGLGYSAWEVFNTCKEVTGINIRAEESPRRPGDPPVLIADSTKIQQELGWRPKYGLREMVQHAWQWELNRRKQQKAQKPARS